MNEMFLYLIPGSGIVALLFVYLKNNWVASKEVGSEKMERIAQNISDGAMAFLRAEYKILSVFVLITALLLGFKGFSIILLTLFFSSNSITPYLSGSFTL